LRKKPNRKERKELAKSAMKEKTLSVHCVNLCVPCGKKALTAIPIIIGSTKTRKERNKVIEIPIYTFTESKSFLHSASK